MRAKLHRMSPAHILELPSLTREERRLLWRRALAIDEADDAAALEHTAVEGFAVLEHRKAADAARAAC